MKRLFTTWLLLLAASSFAFAQQSAVVHLAGYHHVPTVHTSATGTVTVTLQNDTLYVEGHFENLTSHYHSASIHYGPEGESGNRLLRLQVDLDEDHRGGTFFKEENVFDLRQTILQALREGNLYINVASSRRQRGEIRGQIPPMH